MKVSMLGSGLPILQSQIGVVIPTDRRKSKSFKAYQVKDIVRDKANELSRQRLANICGMR